MQFIYNVTSTLVSAAIIYAVYFVAKHFRKRARAKQKARQEDDIIPLAQLGQVTSNKSVSPAVRHALLDYDKAISEHHDVFQSSPEQVKNGESPLAETNRLLQEILNSLEA